MYPNVKLSYIKEKCKAESIQRRKQHRNSVLNCRRNEIDEITEKYEPTSSLYLIRFKNICQLLVETKKLQWLDEIWNGIECGGYFITEFLETPFVLDVIDAFIRGEDYYKEISSLQLISALSFGTSEECSTVCHKFAPHLITLMDGKDVKMVVTCCYALGNFCSGNSDVCFLLKSQGFEATLVNLMSQASYTQCRAVMFSVHYAMRHYLTTSPERIRFLFTTDVIEIMKKVVERSSKMQNLKNYLPLSDLMWCLYLASTEKIFCPDITSNNFFGTIFDILYLKICPLADNNKYMDVVVTTALLRVLINCVASSAEACDEIFWFSPDKNKSERELRGLEFIKICNFSLLSPHLHIVIECQRLIANIMNSSYAKSEIGWKNLVTLNVKEQLRNNLGKSMIASHPQISIITTEFSSMSVNRKVSIKCCSV